MVNLYAVIGFLFSIAGWLILIYAGWRNQRAAKESPLVEDTNFGPRVGSIVEVTLHPDHAATWKRPIEVPGWAEHIGDGKRLLFRDTDGKDWMCEPMTLVFPNLGKDSSEIHGIREDDGEVT